MLHAQFDDPVHDSQVTFRALLQALSEPLQPRPLPVLPAPPAGLLPATAAALLTLLDQDVTLHPGSLPEEACRWLVFHTGVTLADDPAQADFVLLRETDPLPPLDTFRMGDPAWPDRSATLLLETSRFATDQIRGEGPGLAAPQPFGASRLETRFWQDRQTCEALFPLGVDLLLFDADKVAGLPRSTRITEIASCM